jgi:hypothetical protein
MSEVSYLWTTGGAGDGAGTYNRSDWSIITKLLAAATSWEGVCPRFLNKLAATAPAVNTLRVQSGGAIVDGKPYYNSANADITIPSAGTPSYKRIDRVVLRADWTAQTVRLTRIAGTEAVSPAVPAITQTSGTTYDITLYKVEVDTSGNLTVTDERTMASDLSEIPYVIGDSLNTINTGVKGYQQVPFDFLITEVSMVGDASGSAVVDIWKDTFANFPPTDADSITSATPITMSASQKAQDTTLTGWTRTLAAGDWLAFNVDSISTCKQLTVVLRGYKL